MVVGRIAGAPRQPRLETETMFKFAKYGTKEVKTKSGELMTTDNVLVNIAWCLQIKSIGHQAKVVV